MSEIEIALGIEERTTEGDIEKLAQAGAGEFFCGIVPQEWAKIYGYSPSLNKRYSPGQQFTSFEKLDKIIKKIHSLGKKVFITFNSHSYTKEQLPYLERYLHQTRQLNVDAIIVTNMALLLVIKELKLDFNIHIGGDAGSYSARAALFFKKLGVTRIKFPRDISINEMKSVIERTKSYGFEYEAFIAEQRCPFSGVGCRNSHGLGCKDFCYMSWGKNPFYRLPADLTADIDKKSDFEKLMQRIPLSFLPKWKHNSSQYDMWTIAGLFSSFSNRDHAIRECGLCAINKLAAIGVNSLKYVSRGKALKSKLFMLNILKKVVNNPKADTEYCKNIRDNPELCELGYMCYYPEAR